MSARSSLARDQLKIHIPTPSSSAESGLSSSLSPLSPSITSSIHKSHSASSLGKNASPGARITFAPLPSIEPRKRRSASQLKLGVASRSSMMRQRPPVDPGREQREQSQVPKAQKEGCRSPGSEMWQDEKASKTRNEQPRDPDDPFLVVGRLMKSAWRRVSSPQMSPRWRSAPGADDGASEECDAPEEMFSEEELEMERRRQCSHVKSESAHMVEEEGLGAFGDAPIDASTIKLKIPTPNCRSSEAPDTAARTKASAISTVE